MTLEDLHNQKIYAGEYQVTSSDLGKEPQEPQGISSLLCYLKAATLEDKICWGVLVTR